MSDNGHAEAISEAAQSALRAQENAARINARFRAGEPAEDHLTRFRRAFAEPSNSGPARVYGAEASVPSTGARLVGIIEQAAEAEQVKREREARPPIGPEERVRLAREMREAADRVERGR